MCSNCNSCPECNTTSPNLLLVLKDRLVKQCRECQHKWNEEREQEIIRRGGYIYRDATIPERM